MSDKTIEQKLIEVTENVEKVYQAGYEKGKAEGGENPLYYASNLNSTYHSTVFPENYNLTIHLAKPPANGYQIFAYSRNLKNVKFITDDRESLFSSSQGFRESDIETVDFTECSKKLTSVDYLFYGSHNLKTIKGKLDLSNCASFTLSFLSDNLVDIEIVPNTIKANIRFSSKTLSDNSKQSIIDGLAQTDTLLQLDLETVVINSLSTEQQEQILIKNWQVI